MEQAENLCLGGYEFASTKEAQEAAAEIKNIQYLESRIDYADTKKVQAIYEKAVKERIFQTAPGLFYLKGIRDFLVREDERYEAVLPCVPVQGVVPKAKETDGEPKPKTRTAQAKREEKKKNELLLQKQKFRFSVLINCVLGVAVIFMLWVALHTEEPNILNYEKAIKNRYATWEQELSEREKAVKQKELELFRDEDMVGR